MDNLNFTELLTERLCACGKIHKCDIKHIVIGDGVIAELKQFLTPYSHILLVADNHTYSVCGKAVEEQLVGRLETVFAYQRDGVLVPDELAVQEMRAHITAQTDLIVGVGSGVIQDLCKYVSFQHKIPYHIVATAPSMDGYASVGAAMIMDNMKITCSCHVPEVIIGDVDVLKNAPMDMIQSGYGDIIGKYSCLNDWKLSQIVNDEYFCPHVHDLMMDMVLKTQNLGAKLQKRDPDAIQTLMEALAGAGVAMAMVGNSRPASGSEHHMSHYFEITGIVHNEPYLMHGTDVACSAVYTQRLREELLKLPAFPAKRIFCREKWEADIRSIYGRAAEGVIALQDKLGWYQQERYEAYRTRWNAIRNILEQAPSSDKMQEYIQSVGIDLADYDALYGQDKIQAGICYAKDLKDRYSVLWLYYDLLLM